MENSKFSSYSDNYSHSNCDNFYMLDSINTPNSNNIQINTFSDEQEFICDKGSDKQISQSSTNFNYGHALHKSDGYAFDNNPGYCNYDPEDSICNSSTDGESETCQTPTEKDDRHVQVLESLSKVTKYFSIHMPKNFKTQWTVPSPH